MASLEAKKSIEETSILSPMTGAAKSESLYSFEMPKDDSSSVTDLFYDNDLKCSQMMSHHEFKKFPTVEDVSEIRGKLLNNFVKEVIDAIHEAKMLKMLSPRGNDDNSSNSVSKNAKRASTELNFSKMVDASSNPRNLVNRKRSLHSSRKHLVGTLNRVKTTTQFGACEHAEHSIPLKGEAFKRG